MDIDAPDTICYTGSIGRINNAPQTCEFRTYGYNMPCRIWAKYIDNQIEDLAWIVDGSPLEFLTADAPDCCSKSTSRPEGSHIRTRRHRKFHVLEKEKPPQTHTAANTGEKIYRSDKNRHI